MLTWYDKEAKYRDRLWKERNLMRPILEPFTAYKDLMKDHFSTHEQVL